MASNRQTVPTVTHAPDPGASRWVGALDFLRGLGVTGHSGTVRIGLSGSPAVSYRGELGPRQAFRGYNRQNVTAGLRGSGPTSLPTPTSPDASSPVLRALAGQR
jgi:hypothetical protein